MKMDLVATIALTVFAAGYVYLVYVSWAVRKTQARLSDIVHRLDTLANRYSITGNSDVSKLRRTIIAPGAFAPGLVFAIALKFAALFVPRHKGDANSHDSDWATLERLWVDY